MLRLRLWLSRHWMASHRMRMSRHWMMRLATWWIDRAAWVNRPTKRIVNGIVSGHWSRKLLRCRLHYQDILAIKLVKSVPSKKWSSLRQTQRCQFCWISNRTFWTQPPLRKWFVGFQSDALPMVAARTTVTAYQLATSFAHHAIILVEDIIVFMWQRRSSIRKAVVLRDNVTPCHLIADCIGCQQLVKEKFQNPKLGINGEMMIRYPLFHQFNWSHVSQEILVRRKLGSMEWENILLVGQILLVIRPIIRLLDWSSSKEFSVLEISRQCILHIFGYQESIFTTF
mmetsp:Transcript_18033/g.30572  ORF Transcript_18033/g.30572 Transcript_18033/m.30572 type:complete len:284 (+) Transcript_18033:807-1658(+)